MRTAIIAIAYVSIAACGGSLDSTEATQPESTSPADTEPPDRTTIDRGDPNAEEVPETSLAPVIGEVPGSIMESILKDATERTGLTKEQFEVERAEAVTWSDGSLGCPKPGELYTQALVDGYWVEMSGPDVWLDYRVDNNGRFKLCEGNQTPHSADTTSPNVTTAPPGGSSDS